MYKHQKFFFLILLLAYLPSHTHGQAVSTFANVPSNGDVAVDSDGYVYTCSEDQTIRRISPSGVIDPVPFLSGSVLSRATGLAFDPSGDTLYVANRPLNGQGFIRKVNPDGSSELFASGLNFPGDIAFDPSGVMYVTEFNNNVRRIDQNGVATVYVNDAQFNTPIGIAWTPGDTLFVASAHDGNIFKVIPSASPTVQWFAHVDGLVQNWACGFMMYANGALFITNGDNKIHKITLQGVVSDYAGSGGAGGQDGSFGNATFNGPNGICATTDGSKFYVTEWGRSRVRLLDHLASGLDDFPREEFRLYPNPSGDVLKVEYNIVTEGRATVLDSQGRTIRAFNSLPNEIETGTWAPGKYLIRFEIEERIYNRFFIKEYSK